jgi:general secretion pathway protein L
MAELLVIRMLATEAERAEWVVVDDQGALLEPGGQAALPDLPLRANNRRVVLLAPALEVLLTHASVPVRGKQKIQQALPFAMEEQLAEDVESLHFAAGQRDANDALAVAVINRQLVEDWRERLGGAGIAANAAYSEAEGLDRIPGTAVLLIENDTASLRDPDGSLASTDLDGLETLLALWLARSDDDVDTQPHLLVYQAGTELSLEVTEVLEGLQPRLQGLEIRALGESALARLAANLAVAPGINLLQGNYAKRSNLSRYWPAWRLAAALLAAVLVVAVAGLAAENWRLARRADALQQSVEQAFRYTFPDVRTIRDPRAQLQSRLRSLGQNDAAGNGAEFLDVLQQVARAVNDSDGTRLEGIDYRSGTLELRLRAPNVEVLDRIQRDIAAAGGLSAEIQSANAEDDGVMGRLRISTAGA